MIWQLYSQWVHFVAGIVGIRITMLQRSSISTMMMRVRLWLTNLTSSCIFYETEF
uniref:Uncharacterized protein n=1 Tax=Arundo donax TaxID=35708 RepID=A0A0A9GEC8_ARUDO